MGIAAYNRGSAAIRRQIDQELAEKSGAIRERMDFQRLQDERDSLKKERDQLAADMERARFCIARLRATLAVERDESRQRIARLEKHLDSWMGAAMRFKRSWQKAGQMIRDCMTPQQCDEYRQQRDWMEAR